MDYQSSREQCELYEYPPSVFNRLLAGRRENDRLAQWILENIPNEIGDESAVDVAIRLMKQAKGL